jgi:hypothetical protein
MKAPAVHSHYQHLSPFPHHCWLSHFHPEPVLQTPPPSSPEIGCQSHLSHISECGHVSHIARGMRRLRPQRSVNISALRRKEIMLPPCPLQGWWLCGIKPQNNNGVDAIGDEARRLETLVFSCPEAVIGGLKQHW